MDVTSFLKNQKNEGESKTLTNTIVMKPERVIDSTVKRLTPLF